MFAGNSWWIKVQRHEPDALVAGSMYKRMIMIMDVWLSHVIIWVWYVIYDNSDKLGHDHVCLQRRYLLGRFSVQTKKKQHAERAHWPICDCHLWILHHLKGTAKHMANDISAAELHWLAKRHSKEYLRTWWQTTSIKPSGWYDEDGLYSFQ